MKIAKYKSVVLTMDNFDLRMFEVMMHLALNDLNDKRMVAKAESFTIAELNISVKYDEIKLFIQDLKRGIQQ